MVEAIIAFFVVIFAVWGFFKGVILQIFGVSGILLAIIVAPATGEFLFEFSKSVLEWNFLKQPIARTLWVFLIGTFVYSIIVGVGTRFHRRWVKKWFLTRGLDRLGGLFLGGCVGAAIIVLTLQLFSSR